MVSALRTFLLTIGLLCAAGFALAQSVVAPSQPVACTEPPPPTPVDGATVSEDQMRAAVAAAKGYIAQSDLYRSCLEGELDAARTQAGTEGKPMDPDFEGALRTRMAVNEKTRRKVEFDINNAIVIYKKPHIR